MNAKLKSAVSSLGAFGGVVAYFALMIAVLAAFFLALKFLAAAANILAAISLILIVPFLLLPLLFARTRRFCGNGMIVISYLLGASTWLTATVWLNDLWGAAAVIVGVLIFGIGSVPLGCLALLLHGRFAMLFILLGQLAAVYILRIVGIWTESKGTSERTGAAQDISAAEEARQWLQKGRDFYDLADAHDWNPTKAIECFEHGLEVMPDNTNLHVYLGMMYSDGHGVSQDYAQAFEHFSVAAELGDSNGQRSLAEMFEDGNGVPRNAEKAASWYRKAAEQGDSFAQYKLGFLHYTGSGVRQDLGQAFSWYLRASQQGETAAQLALGNMYAKGEGTESDPSQAGYWHRKAAESEDGDTKKRN